MRTFVGSLVILLVAIWGFEAKHVHMEEMIERSSFRKLHRSDSDHMHEVIVAIPKQNIDEIEKLLFERASPESPNHLQWLSYDEVSTYIENQVSYDVVVKWLQENKLDVSWTSRRKDYLRVMGKIAKWENLLQTEFYEFLDESLPKKKNIAGQSTLRNNDDHRVFHRAKSYSIPEEVRPHITAIFNTVQTPPFFHKKYHMKNPHPKYGTPYRSYFRLQMDGVDPADNSVSSNGVVTVSFLNSYYNITSNTGLPNLDISQSVFETGENYFSPSDLTKFQNTYCLPEQAALSVGNHELSSCPTSSPTAGPSCVEGNLDIQYMMGISQQTVSVFWWAADGTAGTSSDPFLVWILAVADEVNPPKVNSISYGIAEYGESSSVLSQFNTEAMLLGLQGVTITASSGDNGAPNLGGNTGSTCLCNYNSGSAEAPWATSIPAADAWVGLGYFPSFPASSPYVTAVGATMGPEVGSTEVACESKLGGVITSGGGFSTYFSAPSWQKTAIADYFSHMTANNVLLFPGYNPNGRGYPDVSLIGVEYQVVVGGAIASVFGTSCSSPVFAAMVSLLNAHLYHSGRKTTLGYLNPALWSAGKNSTANPSTYANVAFNDITSGNNQCCASQYAAAAVCCSSGFQATTGWDPVTGWGSIQFDHLANIFGVFNRSTISSAPVTCKSTSSNEPGLSDGVTAAVVIVVLLVVGLLVGLGLYLVCHGGNRRKQGRLVEQEVVTAVPVVYVQNPSAGITSSVSQPRSGNTMVATPVITTNQTHPQPPR